MKILFGVQTEGNGHTIQAIATKQFLEENGHQVSCAFAAKKNKGLAKFFTDEFKVVEYDGFDFVFGKDGKMILWKTILKNTYELPKFIYSFYKICKTINKEKPDVICNFYEPLVGLSALLYPKIKYISIGHQYAMTLPQYPQISGFPIQKFFLKLINCVSSINAKILALSFYEIKNDNILVCPPILRNESYVKSNDTQDFILVYLMNEDMLPDLINQAGIHKNISIECFTRLTKSFDLPSNLKVHNLNGKLFQEKMKVCKSVVCSGGFETTSEAILQNKPVLMIPMPNHYEQHANCNDAKLAGYANYNNKIDLDKIPQSQIDNTEWFLSYKDKLNQLFK